MTKISIRLFLKKATAALVAVAVMPINVFALRCCNLSPTRKDKVPVRNGGAPLLL